MKYRNLGHSGLIVSRLCLGGMTFGEQSSRGVAEKEAQKLVSRFLDAGGNFIDTADAYGGGESEKIIGRAVAGIRDQVVIGTKVRFNSNARNPNEEGLSRRYIIRAVEESLRRLDTDYIDVYTMAGIDPLTPMEETVRAFDELVRSGKVRYVGLTNFKAWQVVELVSMARREGLHPLIAAQYQYSLVCRDIENEFFDICEKYGLGLTCWGPLGGGFLSGKYSSKNVDLRSQSGRVAIAPQHAEEAWDRRASSHNFRIVGALEEIAARKSVTVPQVAIAWILAKQLVSSILVGVRNSKQLESVLDSVNVELDRAEVLLLDEVSNSEPPYPYRMIDNYAKRSL